MKFYSKEFPERKPIYIEFCVTHASDEAKLHSGNKIIEILIDDEERISSLIESGLVEKSETIGEEWEGRKIKIVAFYGFKTKDYNNSTMSEDVGFTRCVLMPSGKIYISSEHCSCKQIGRKDHRALCEIVFSLFTNMKHTIMLILFVRKNIILATVTHVETTLRLLRGMM